MTRTASATAEAGTAIGYACNGCGRLIFRTDQLVETRPLWDLGEYDGESYLVRDLASWDGLRRYDVSLHQGWYCCRFIVMRMTFDKFGTGDALLVYTDSVHPVTADEQAAPRPAPPGATMLTGRNHDQVLRSPQLAGTLAVVKFGAIWCPPCRLMDKAVSGIESAGGVRGVRFFDVDVDHDPVLARRFRNRSIPYTVVYHDGIRIPVEPAGRLRLRLLDGGVVGAIGTHELTTLVTDTRNRLAADTNQVTG